ncbi:MAG TPA: DNA methyltransferase [Pyrinomonadaceae bacterium]
MLDPFAGSATTGIAANLLNRRFVGIEIEEEYLRLGKQRKIEIENPQAQKQFREKINGFRSEQELSNILIEESKQN